jgi:radical SAM enzyme (rSAM/lipoprotein system)
MNLGDFVKVLEEIRSNWNPNKIMLNVVGGEPLMRNDLENCGKTFYNLGFPWGIVTNGYLLTERRFESLVSSSMGSISVSVDGLKESHNWLRGNKDSFERALSAIRIILEKKHIVFDVITCINQKNIDELQEIKKLLIETGVKKWRIFNIFPKGRATDDPLLIITDKQFKELLEFIKSTKMEKSIDVNYACEGFLGDYENEARDGFFYCRSGINVASVLIDGSISGCLSCRGDYIQGNIYKDSFVDVWNDKFGIMRERQWMKTGICKDCKVFKWCEGNGLHLRSKKTDEPARCHYRMLE